MVEFPFSLTTLVRLASGEEMKPEVEDCVLISPLDGCGADDVETADWRESVGLASPSLRDLMSVCSSGSDMRQCSNSIFSCLDIRQGEVGEVGEVCCRCT